MDDDKEKKTDEDEDEPWWVSPPNIALGGAGILIILLWLLYPTYIDWKFPCKLLEPGTYGDMYGALNTFFTGMAFALLIYTALLQREELKEQRKELQLTRAEFESTRKVFEQQTAIQDEQLQLVKAERKEQEAERKERDIEREERRKEQSLERAERDSERQERAEERRQRAEDIRIATEPDFMLRYGMSSGNTLEFKLINAGAPISNLSAIPNHESMKRVSVNPDTILGRGDTARVVMAFNPLQQPKVKYSFILKYKMTNGKDGFAELGYTLP